MITALTQEDALAVARQRPPQAVRLVAIDYNWGAPVSGRFDTDYMNLWAVAGDDPQGTLYLQGQHVNGKWDINTPFELVQTVEGQGGRSLGFYALRLGSQYEFPQEFVLRYENGNAEVEYDNNEGRNYRITPYRGHGGSAIASGEAIFSLEGISTYRLYGR